MMKKNQMQHNCPSMNRQQHAAEHRWLSTMLVAGHMAETALQIYLCYHYWPVTTRWAAGLVALLVATTVLINAASIVGVRRGLDFADRWFGKCLCYVMHLSLLGIVWRFLKLTFLYDRTDLREFALLRFVQVHLQTLPSLLLQTCLIYQHGLLDAVPIALAVTQLVIAGVTISLTTLVLSMPTSSEPKRGFSGHQIVITSVRSCCLLWCRTVAVGVFMTEFHVWTLIVFGVHWCIALLWLVLQDSASELQSGHPAPSPAVSLFRRALVAYLLVFDWPPRYQPKHAGWSKTNNNNAKEIVAVGVKPAAGAWMDVVGLGGEPQSVAVAVYYGVSGVENAAMLSLWFHFAPVSALVPPVARLTTLATCTAALTLGVLCVVASTQGPDDESTPAAGSEECPAVKSAAPYAGSTTTLPCTLIQQREIVQRTVVAQVHPLTQSAIDSLPPPPPRPETTWMTERAAMSDDQSSNSRNTNTMTDVGASSPVQHHHHHVLNVRTTTNSPAVNMSTHPVARRNSPFTVVELPQTDSISVVKRPYVSGSGPLSSTPRSMRRACVSPRMAKTLTAPNKKQQQRQRRQARRSSGGNSCHCKIFDCQGHNNNNGILIKENGSKTIGRMSHDRAQFQILCAKCLGRHDPLLTNCQRRPGGAKTLPSRNRAGQRPQLVMLDTSACSTNYPTDTEAAPSSSSASSSSGMESDATYTTWPPSLQPQTLRVPSMERLLEVGNPSPWNYVQAWLANANQQQSQRVVAAATTSTTTRRKHVRPKRLDTVPRHAHLDVYSTAYCTVPPRLSAAVSRDPALSLRRLTVAVEHQYSTPVEIAAV